MKHLASQRRRWLPLIFLLIIFLGFYLWVQENLESFIEKRLGLLLNSDVELGGVRGGIAGNLVLINLKILPRNSPFSLPAFEAKKVQLNFRLRDILFGKITFKNIFPLTIREAKLSTVRPIVTGLSARISEFRSDGDFYLFGNTKMKFAGDTALFEDGLKINRLSIVKVPAKESISRQREERIDIKGRIDSSNFLVDVKLDHFRIGGIDLSTNIKIKNEIAEDVLKGELITSDSIMDFKPVKEIKASYEFFASQFRLIALEWAEGIKLSGIVSLRVPAYEFRNIYLDLVLELRDINMGVLVFFAGLGKKKETSGLVNGEFSVEGFLPFPDIKGSAVSGDGHIGTLRYNQAKLNLEGRIPIIKIVNSWVQKGESYTFLEGEVDLGKIGSTGLFEDLKVVGVDKTILWAGWDITRNSEPELKLGKDVGENFRVSFKTFMNNELLNEDLKEDEFGLDYKISEDGTLKMRLKENEEFLGIERKMKF